MLVLTINIDQPLRIGEDVTLRILRTRRRKVMIGVDAPRAIKIRRMKSNDGGKHDGIRSRRGDRCRDEVHAA